ncbi:TIGR02444 family protein [Gilvimarinus chinensis]|uniref:TIGR02444 family protein n=1 Tax=Gilvimarinus chinensis TaxID=396005 RepID=UPI00036BD793|nr:TIGR02444 family protein [Gilvimarinus chinensis]
MPDSLWNFAVRLYSQKSVESLCLQLQDDWQANVPLLLFYQWLDSTGRALTESQAKQAEQQARHWQSNIITPLRTARRALKITPYKGELRQHIKDSELEAEQQLLQQLEGLAPKPCAQACAIRHAEAYLQSLQVDSATLNFWREACVDSLTTATNA